MHDRKQITGHGGIFGIELHWSMIFGMCRELTGSSLCFFDFEQSAKAVFVEYIAMMGFSEWAERGSKAGNGCPCAKGSHTVVFLPGNFGGKDD